MHVVVLRHSLAATEKRSPSSQQQEATHDATGARSVNTPPRYGPSYRHRPAGGPHRKRRGADVTCCMAAECYFTVHVLQVSSVSTVTRLLARRPRNRGSSPAAAHFVMSALPTVSTGGDITHTHTHHTHTPHTLCSCRMISVVHHKNT